MLVSSQHDDKWTAKGQFRLESVPKQQLLNREELSRLRLKAFDQQKRPSDGRRERPPSSKSQCYAQYEMRGAKQGNHQVSSGSKVTHATNSSLSSISSFTPPKQKMRLVLTQPHCLLGRLTFLQTLAVKNLVIFEQTLLIRV